MSVTRYYTEDEPDLFFSRINCNENIDINNCMCYLAHRLTFESVKQEVSRLTIMQKHDDEWYQTFWHKLPTPRILNEPTG